MRIGDHTFAIVSKSSINEVVAQRLFRRYVMHSVAPDLRCQQWGSVVVSARPKLDPIGKANARRMRPVTEQQTDLLSTGTPGLDAMITGCSDYWFTPQSKV